MSTAYTTYQQHEPLRAPSGWGTQEKRFVAQLEETFDDIYRRFGRLRLEDMGAEFQKTFKAFSGDLSELQTDIEINAQGISTLTQKTGINSLGANETLYSKINVNAGDITTLVNKTGINSLGQNETLYSKINQTANSVEVTFKKIGASGYTATGITTITENGITVTHSSISNCKTQMNANGFRILNSNNTVIGGLMTLNGSVVTAMNALYNPSYSNFVAKVGQFQGLADSIYGMQFCWSGTPYMNFGIGYIEDSVVDTEIVASNNLIIKSSTKVSIDCGNQARIEIDPNNDDIFFYCSEGSIAMSTIIWMLYNNS